ncbi:Pectinesterase inhibitor domain - like 10 [Theobroma cacao]|nr:Pectinesterase inhibitor domain - like 10 [Theobroma cacao]
MSSCFFLDDVSSLFMLLIISSATLATSSRLQGKDLVSNACSHTQFYEVCVSTLKSDPQNEKSDIRGLADIALNVSTAYGMETLSHINSLKFSPGNYTPFASRCLSDCMEEYSDAVDNLQESAQALRTKSYTTVNTLVAAAMTDSDTCEGGFGEMPGNEPPLTQRNQYFYKLCSNFLAITTLLS